MQEEFLDVKNQTLRQRPSTFPKALVFICETPSCEGTHKNLISKSVFEVQNTTLKREHFVVRITNISFGIWAGQRS